MLLSSLPSLACVAVAALCLSSSSSSSSFLSGVEVDAALTPGQLAVADQKYSHFGYYNIPADEFELALGPSYTYFDSFTVPVKSSIGSVGFQAGPEYVGPNASGACRVGVLGDVGGLHTSAAYVNPFANSYYTTDGYAFNVLAQTDKVLLSDLTAGRNEVPLHQAVTLDAGVYLIAFVCDHYLTVYYHYGDDSVNSPTPASIFYDQTATAEFSNFIANGATTFGQGDFQISYAAISYNYEFYFWVTASGANGDPQFTGFSGQSYQVHGSSGSIYNIISSPSFQYNANFNYLESGRCRSGTQCFSHPGNYFGSVGVLVKSSGQDQSLVIESGAVDVGLQVRLNNQTLSITNEVIRLNEIYQMRYSSPFEVVLESNDFNVRIQNSDFFLNQDVSIGENLAVKIREYKRTTKSVEGGENSELAKQMLATLPHGVLGQTWRLKTYDNRWKHIEGQLFDYLIEGEITGTQFKYNRF